MLARSPRVDVTIFAGMLALTGVLLASQAAARAAGNPPAAPAARAAAPQAAEIKHAPAPAPAANAQPRSLYGCNPGQDLACTVIHETAKGVVVVTFRPTGAKETRSWSVVNAPAETSGDSAGGTIYIVPGGARQLSSVQPAVHTAVPASVNGAPIID